MNRTALAAALAALLASTALQAETPPPRLVSVRPLSEVVLHPQRSAPATAVSLNDSRISAQIRARIDAIPVKVGESVSKGQPLVQLDCRDYRLNLRAQQAALALAQQQAERARSLAGQQLVAEELLNQRQAELDTAAAQRDRAALDVDRCVITAPFDGVVTQRLAGVGEYADTGAPLLRLLDAGAIEVSAQVPIDAADSLAGAGRLLFETQGSDYPLKLRTLTPAINSEARNREVRLTFAGRRALPGAAGRLVWEAAAAHVPADLVVRRDGGLGLFVAENGRARLIPLPKAQEGQPAAVALPPTTEVIIEGRHGLRDGDPIHAEAAR